MRAARFVVNGFLILALLGWGLGMVAFMRINATLDTNLIQLLNALAYLVALVSFREGSRLLCALMVILATASSVEMFMVDWRGLNPRLAISDSLAAFFSWICAGCFLFLRATRDHPSLEVESSPRYAVDDPE